ncbi:hypothetical protein LWC34_02930 [Kibdelosporangium philippinense]|uniref:Uncharacterized protein n=1 Tax=Kibdelosporangium philippinense TaxID=211113 RepID=A0ABS8Z1J3_9PSEU|nr:hypothetical protein [Kibdelosporangium philippinense]MCE7001799.1 hypothetical protein [Kibdelosporangium philippinense]
MTMPPIGGYYPAAPGPAPMTPEQAAALTKMVKDAVAAAYTSPPEWYKGEATAVKHEINGLANAFNLVKVEWTAFKLEPPSIWEIIQQRRARARGEAPEQLKALGDSAKKRADSAHQLAQTSLRRANELNSSMQRLFRNQIAPVKQSADTLRTQVTQLSQRVTAVGRDATAALQGVRRVGGDLNQANRRITTLERRQQSSQGGGRGQDAAALRREGDRTRQAVRDLTNAMRAAGPGSQQFKRQLDAIEQSLR